MVGCSDVITGASQRCSDHCRNSLIALTSTDEGEALMKVLVNFFLILGSLVFLPSYLREFIMVCSFPVNAVQMQRCLLFREQTAN